MTYTVRNTGNVRLAGHQELTVQGLFGLGGRSVTLEDLPEILPGQSVTATARIEGVAPLLWLRGDLQVQPVPPPQFADDPAGAPAAAQVAMWGVPWPELLVLLVLAALAAGAVWLRRRRERRTQAMLAEAVAKARDEGREQARQDKERGQAATGDAEDSRGAEEAEDTAGAR